MLFGLTIPLEGWIELGWGGLTLVIAALLLRQLPAALTLKPLLGVVRGRDGLVSQLVRTIGVAALYYASLCMREARIEEARPVASLLICASIIAHGVTTTPLTRL